MLTLYHLSRHWKYRREETRQKSLPYSFLGFISNQNLPENYFPNMTKYRHQTYIQLDNSWIYLFIQHYIFLTLPLPRAQDASPNSSPCRATVGSQCPSTEA